MIKNQPAVFLDRDGTIMEDVGTVSDPAKIQLYDDTVQALRLLQKSYQLFIVTNQAGVSRGEITLEQVDTVHAHLSEMLRKDGIIIQEFFTCPHTTEDQCDCKKPKPGMIHSAAKKYGLDLKRSFIIGDHPHDTETAQEQGLYGLYVLTGHGQKHLHELNSEALVFHRLQDAVDWILNHPEPTADLAREISVCADLIKKGGVAAFPTETVYGLGADVFNVKAVANIFKIKCRPTNNPLIAHIVDIGQLELLSERVPEKARLLMERFWPGPLTIIFDKKDSVPDIVTAGNSTIAVRMPAHPIARALIAQAGTPVAAPSANRFTCTSPTTARHVRDQLGSKCKFIIDGGACRVGVESTVITFSEKIPTVLRPGGISQEEIEAVIGPVASATLVKDGKRESPGQMKNHYAPVTPLRIMADIDVSLAQSKDIGFILLKPTEQIIAGPVEILSKIGDLEEAAINFYAAIRRLDEKNLKQIVCCSFPAEGMGAALNDRLGKAAQGQLRHDM